MDLSHLDISKTFTLTYAAYAAVGIDPATPCLATPQESGRADHIAREMMESIFAAGQYVRVRASGLAELEQTEPCGPLVLDIWGDLQNDGFDHMLMSVQLEQLVIKRNKTGGRVDLLELPESLSELLFSREELSRWFSVRGFQPVYQFIKTASQDQAAIAEPSTCAEFIVKPLPQDASASSILNIRGATMAKLAKAVSAFPEKYPEYQSKPPKKEGDMDEWLETTFNCSTRESFVFASILREHFGLSS